MCGVENNISLYMAYKAIAIIFISDIQRYNNLGSLPK